MTNYTLNVIVTGMADSVHPVRAFRLRQDPPLSQGALADLADTTAVTISRIENGQAFVRPRLLRKLIEVTGLQATDICSGLNAMVREAAE